MQKQPNKVPMNYQDILDTLCAAKALIENPKNWTIHFSARDIEDRPIKIGATGACKFCAVGALQQALLDFSRQNESKETEISQLYSFFPVNIPKHYADDDWGAKGVELTHINDSKGHGEIMKLFDLAIEKCYMLANATQTMNTI